MSHLQPTPGTDPLEPRDPVTEDPDGSRAGEADLRREEIARAEDEGMTEAIPGEVTVPDDDPRFSEPPVEAPGAPGPDAAQVR